MFIQLTRQTWGTDAVCNIKQKQTINYKMSPIIVDQNVKHLLNPMHVPQFIGFIQTEYHVK